MKLWAASNLFKFTYVLLIPIRAMFSKLLLDINQFRTELKPYLKINQFFVKIVLITKPNHKLSSVWFE